jgi:GT2 family glycosyltransferase
MNYKIAAIVLTYNDTVFTKNLCDILIAENEVNNIVVVDNSDQTEFVEQNQKIFNGLNKKLHYIKTSENGGYAAGNNVGIKYILENCVTDFIWIMNNDIIPQRNAAPKMMETILKNGGNAICGSILYYYKNNNKTDESSVVQCYGGGKYYPLFGKSRLHCKGWNANRMKQFLTDKKVDFIIGASMMVPVSIFEIAGLIPEEYFMYNEELDWQTLAKKRGFQLVVADDSHIIHLDGMSTKNKKEHYYYYMNRASVLFTKKYYLHFIPTVLLYRMFDIFFLTPGIKNKYFGIKGIIDGILFSKKRS